MNDGAFAARVDLLSRNCRFPGIAAIENDGAALGDETGRDLLAMPELPPVTIATLS
jgi:hypothetical protein